MGKDLSELEILLNRDEFFYDGGTVDTNKSYNTNNLQKAKGTASLLDFIDMVALIVESTMDDMNVTFMTDERAYLFKEDPLEPINHPMVTFKVLDRVHTEKAAYKPRYMEEITGDDGRPGIIYNERFTNMVQFNIIAPEYRIAWNVMERFEDLMISYAETIRGNGIVEYFFLKQYRDSYYDSFRNTFTVLSLVYRVDTETLRVIFKENINDIIANNKNQ
jgi:hypothetical protein